MNYGANNQTESGEKQEPPESVKTDQSAYWKYYYGDKPPATTDPNYPAWYQYFYGDRAATGMLSISDMLLKY